MITAFADTWTWQSGYCRDIWDWLILMALIVFFCGLVGVFFALMDR